MLYGNLNCLVQLQSDIIYVNILLRSPYLKIYCVPCGHGLTIDD